ncbi:MAG: peptidase [Segetibacter sp.]|nr:peptidase [Segetibacter sp.]
MPCTVGGSGPTKSITLNNSDPVSFYLSTFPDRAGGDENYILTVNSYAGQQNFPVLVIDQDPPTPSIDFNIITDFSKDNPAYNFFSNQAYWNIVRQAADDWAFFIQNMNFEQVQANAEQTFIWNDEYSSGYWTGNQTAYTGFLLYVYGTHNTPHRSGGGPSTHAFQRTGGTNTQLRRSGTYEAEVHGNYNTLGWNTDITDNTWYQATNFGDVPNDLYSIALHEMGHALCFNPGYPQFQTYKAQGYIDHPGVVSYQGSNVPVDAFDHLSNGSSIDALKQVDRVSKKGAYGSEYAAFVPYGRWLICKLNLLCLKAIGYNIKQTSAFVDVNIVTPALPNGSLGQNYTANINAQGGIPFYKFDVLSGSLPAGLSLNSFNGTVSGTPTQSGSYSFTIRVTDYDNKFFDKSFSIKIPVVYTFTGNGNWNTTANWSNNLVPSLPITSDMEIVIDHAPGGQCTFTGNMIIQQGGKLKVLPGKTFNIKTQ